MDLGPRCPIGEKRRVKICGRQLHRANDNKGMALVNRQGGNCRFSVKIHHDLRKVIDPQRFDFVDAKGHIGYRRDQ